MARSLAATKKAKAAYSRRYRKTAAGKKQTTAYNRKTVDERASRNAARAKIAKRVGKKALKGKEIHHVDSTPTNNGAGNLKIAKKGHGGGVKGNKNARKKRKR